MPALQSRFTEESPLPVGRGWVAARNNPRPDEILDSSNPTVHVGRCELMARPIVYRTRDLSGA
jgi:hypothetical protein